MRKDQGPLEQSHQGDGNAFPIDQDVKTSDQDKRGERRSQNILCDAIANVNKDMSCKVLRSANYSQTAISDVATYAGMQEDKHLTASQPCDSNMATDDFGIEGLAEYLHSDPAQVARLADRGRLPGRKVGGQWRFSRVEINQWLERQIGVSNEDELVQMEGMLGRNPGAAAEPTISIADMLPLEAIAVPLAAKTRGAAITAMCALAAQTGWLWEPDKMAEAVRVREDLQSTALDNGVALLHPRRPMPGVLSQAFLSLGISPGIAFGGPRGTITDIFFLICSLEDRGHLRVLARLSSPDQQPDVAGRSAARCRSPRRPAIDRRF